MHSALIPYVKIITAKEYNEDFHGNIIKCIDSSCHVLVFFWLSVIIHR